MIDFVGEVSADFRGYQGPLVGQREPCTKITTEYATADPVYQAKTAVSSHILLVCNNDG